MAGRPLGRGRRVLYCTAVVAVLVGLVTAFTAGARRPPEPVLHGDAVWSAASHPAPRFALRDQDGRTVSLADQRGRVVLLTFLDSRCTKTCPVEARQLAAVEQTLGRTVNPVLLVISVNPADRPATARAFMRRSGLDRGWPWHWLMGTKSQLAGVWQSYQITVLAKGGDIAHDTLLYLIDRSGRRRAGYLFPLQVRDVAADTRALSTRSRWWTW